MINLTKEEIKAFNDSIKAFFDKISETKKQLQEDLEVVELPWSNRKICDLGCGFGYTTYCLTSLLKTTQTTGIDIDPLAINQAENWFKAVKLYEQLTSEQELSDDVLTAEAKKILGIEQPPNFVVGDVISGENLPLNVSLAYCRRLLVNIVHGDYKDKLSGIERVKLVIRNITNTIVPEGWFVAVEESSGGDFSKFIEEEGLSCVNIIPFQLSGIVPYRRYIYKKLS